MSAPIALLTDFGLQDAYVGVMKAAILSRAPSATLIDLTHDLPPQDIQRGAFLLATSVEYFPPSTIFLAVVDPGVGTQRRGLALQAGSWRFVGPDNGLLSWSLHFLARAGQVEIALGAAGLELRSGVRAVELIEPRFWAPTVSATFHGRDLFGPVSAALSLGVSLDELGPDLGSIVDLAWLEPRQTADGAVEGTVISVDRYGNLITNLRPEDLPPRPYFTIAHQHIVDLAPHFQSSSPFLALLGSAGFVEICAPNASAADSLSTGVGARVEVRPG
jgi:S-adenosyl-L-methionine hydrolase (adenosine-forming)